MSSHDVTLNGCVIAYSYSRLSKKCRNCTNKDYCREKQKEIFAVRALPINFNPIMESSDATKLSQAMAESGVSAEEALNALTCMTKACIKFGGDSI